MNQHLIESDQRQRQLALDAKRSFIVQAPAGSGKTELLIQRFLTLLNHVKTPEEILAITFTKKAANEMRARVIKALKHALSDPEPELAHAKQTWTLARKVLQRDKQLNWHLINNPNQLRIQTIDSLCTYLTKQLPLLSHFGSQPGIADNPASLYREAVQEILMHVEENFEWSQAISQLLLHLDNDLNKLHSLLVNLLAKRDQWLPYIQLNSHSDEIKKKLEQHLQLVINDSLLTLSELFPKDLVPELIEIARFAADQLALSNPHSEILACRDLIKLPEPQSDKKEAWVGLAKLLLTKSLTWRKRVDEEIGFPALNRLKNPQEKLLHNQYRQRLAALIGVLSDQENLRSAFADLFFLPAAQYQETQWEILQSLLMVLKIVAAQLRLTFQQQGKIDFIENAQAALLALGNDEHPTDLALALDYQIQHILVDEFQDTSFTQFQLIEKLTTGWETNDGRTLFIVGDPMQSIYRFREAEVGLFIRMRKKGIGNINLMPLTLAINFRSTAQIVEWNNLHFQAIFPSFNDMASGAVTYSHSVSQTITNQPEAHSAIDVRGFLNADERLQADKIVALIKETQCQYPKEKIAILVRSRTHLSAIIPALKKAKLAYRAVDIDPLASRQIIQDLLSLTCALLHPADRIAWLAILRAPWCGLTLADLLILAGNHPYATLWEQLERQEIIMQLSADGQQRLARILPILKGKIAERERIDLRSWIENTWLLLGGPTYFNDMTDLEDAKAFFRLLDEFKQNNPVWNLEKLKEKINQLYASVHADETELQIMTIHTAKGLEFDTVILPHLERKLPHDDKSLLLWMEQPLTNDQLALLLAPIQATGDDKDAIYEYIQRQQRIKTDYETDRLFYVAATRAKKRLHLLFNVEQNDKGDLRIESGSFLQKIWSHIEKHKQDILVTDHLLPTIGNTDNTQRHILRACTDWKNPIKEYTQPTIAYHQKTDGFQLGDHKRQFIGIVVHRVLQFISERGISWWKQQNEAQQSHYLQQQLMQLGVLPSDLELATGMTRKSIRNTLNDARGQWILQAHREAKSEFSISAFINARTVNIIIDRTFIDEHDTRWIIDYKTSTLSHQDLEVFLAKEQEKYLEKMHQYAQIMKLFDARPIKLGLYFPALPAWKEWNPEEL